MKVTGSNPVCASIINKLTYKHMEQSNYRRRTYTPEDVNRKITREGQFATKQNPTPKPLSKWRRILNILFE